MSVHSMQTQLQARHFISVSEHTYYFQLEFCIQSHKSEASFFNHLVA